MSSPIASRQKNVIQKFFVGLHQKLSHVNRVNILAGEIAMRITDLFPDREDIRCLDLGCGDMKITESISMSNSNTAWTCMDLYELPEHLRGTEKWKSYKRFDGILIPLEDTTADVVLLCDVLHHIRGKKTEILRDAGRVGKTVIIKDHFEYTSYSRIVLKAMDFIGNWGYGVQLPESYLTKSSFERLYKNAGLKLVRLDIGIDMYSHIPLLRTLLKPQWQFIAVLSK